MAESRAEEIITLSDSEESLNGDHLNGEPKNNYDKILADVFTVSSLLEKSNPDMKISMDAIFAQLEHHRYDKHRIEFVVKKFTPNLENEPAAPLSNYVKLERTNDEQRDELFDDETVNKRLVLKMLRNFTDTSTTDDETLLSKGEPYTFNNTMRSSVHPMDLSLPSTSGAQRALTQEATSLVMNSTQENIYEKLLMDVQSVMNMFPDSDYDDVYSRLDALKSVPNRVDGVIAGLTKLSPNSANIKRDLENNIHEINFKKAKTDNETGSADVINWDQPGPSHAYQNQPPEVEQPRPSTSNSETSSNEDSNDDIQKKLTTLKETFPDADPDYLMEIIVNFDKDELTFNEKVSEMLENPNYPKLKDKKEREKMEMMKQTFLSRVYTPEDVLQWFEDPVAYFSDITRPVTDSYKQHTILQIYNDFPKLTITSIKAALLSAKWHYFPTYHKLQELEIIEKPLARYRRRLVREKSELPAIPDELFYKELAFRRIEAELNEYKVNKRKERERKIEEARSARLFATCNCCYEEELLMDEAVDCGSNHLFCEECVSRGAEVAAGQGLCHLGCMADGCNSSFPLAALRSVLKPNVFSSWLIRLQAEEVSKANIPDLVQCLHCSFAAIMPNPEDKVFKCLNPECLKETCRLCKEPNHVPLRCEEIERASETKMRTYIEDKMTEALIRVCSSCNRRFMKEVGCNMMKCVCGQSMCYVCRKPIKDYSHFGPNGCPQDINIEELHRKEVAAGGAKAKEELMQQHPELSEIHLKNDPTINPTLVPSKTAKRQGDLASDDSEYSDIDDELDYAENVSFSDSTSEDENEHLMDIGEILGNDDTIGDDNDAFDDAKFSSCSSSSFHSVSRVSSTDSTDSNELLSGVDESGSNTELLNEMDQSVYENDDEEVTQAASSNESELGDEDNTDSSESSDDEEDNNVSGLEEGYDTSSGYSDSDEFDYSEEDMDSSDE